MSPPQEIIKELEKQILAFQYKLEINGLSESHFIEVRTILPDATTLIVTGIGYSNPYFYTVEGVIEETGGQGFAVFPYSRLDFVCRVRQKTAETKPMGFVPHSPPE